MINPRESRVESLENQEQISQTVEDTPTVSSEEMVEVSKAARLAEEGEKTVSKQLSEERNKLENLYNAETPKEILPTLQEAARQDRPLNLTIARADGTLDTGVGTPYFFPDKGFYVGTEYGGIPINERDVIKAEA